jgi:LemA protein
MGRVEVQGKARPAGTLPLTTSPLSGRQCAWWQAEVEQETGSGKNKSWKSHHKASTSSWISVDDGSGPILVDIPSNTPSSADSKTFSQSDLPTWLTSSQLTEVAQGQVLNLNSPPAGFEAPGLFARIAGELTQGFDLHKPISQLGGKWRVTERYLAIDSPVYVIGPTTYEAATHRAFFQQSKGKPLFVYSGTEEQLVGNTRSLSLGALAVLLVSSYFTFAVWMSDRVGAKLVLNHGAGFRALITLAVAGLVIWVIRIRNRVAATQQQVRAGQGLVDIALQQRAQLVPNLVAIVQASTTHTETLLTHLTELRASNEPGAGVLDELRVTAERYPTLSTSANYLHLQQTLVDIETDLAVARGFVADATGIHRTRIESFPDSLIAKAFRVG